MPRIKTEQLLEGMIISADVKNMDGMLLIPTGAALSERQIRILQSWGVTEVDVQPSASIPNPDPLSRLTPEAVEQLRSEVRSRFWQTDDTDPVFAEIFRLIVQRKAGSGGS